MSEVSQKVGIITGASRGIGQAIAVKMAEKGYHLGLVARQREGLETTASLCHQFGVKTLCLPVDIANPMLQRSIIESVTDELGPPECLINNAGVFASGPTEKVVLRDWAAMFEINTKAAMALTYFALPYLKRQKGAVIFISSIAGKIGFPNLSGYCASKFALQGFAGALFEEVRESGVKVCTINPGLVDTDMAKNRGFDSSKMIRAEDIAQSVDFILSFPSNACPTEIIIQPQYDPKPE